MPSELPCDVLQRAHQHFFRGIQRVHLGLEPAGAVVGVRVLTAGEDGLNVHAGEQAVELVGVGGAGEEQEHIRGQHVQAEGLLRTSHKNYLDETVAVLRSEVHGEVETVLRVVHGEKGRAGVQEDASALTPDLARLSDELQRVHEHEEGQRRTVHSISQADKTGKLVDDLNERSPQAAGAFVVHHHLAIQRQRRRVLTVLHLHIKHP